MESIRIKTDVTKLPNKMHFDVQRSTRAQTFVDRKRRLKSGYTKHKGRDDWR